MPAGPAEVATWRQPREPHNGPSGARARSKSVRQAARQAALQGSQSQAAASSSDRLEGLPWLPFEWAGFFPLPLRCGGLGSFPFPLPCHTFTYQTLIFLSVLNIDLNMEFIGTRQKSRFWSVEVGTPLKGPWGVLERFTFWIWKA